MNHIKMKSVFIFIFLSCSLSIAWALISAVNNSYSNIFFGGITYLALLFVFLSVLWSYQKDNPKELILVRIISYKFFSLAITMVLIFITGVDIDELVLTKFQKNALVYELSYWEDEEGSSGKKSVPIIALPLSDIKENKDLPDYLHFRYYENTNNYTIINLPNTEYEDRFYLEYSLTNIYPLYHNYKLHDIKFHWSEKYLYGGLIYCFEILARNWFSIVLSVVFLMLHIKYSDKLKKYTPSYFDI